MSLVTTPLNIAESYCSVAFADSYFSARNVSNWDGSEAHKEGLLRIATEYMDSNYDWAGTRLEKDQTLMWPRSNVIVDGYVLDSDEIPLALMRACAELAHRANTVTLNADLSRSKTRTKVDVIEVEYNPYESQKLRFPAVDALLSDYVVGGSSGANHRLIRA